MPAYTARFAEFDSSLTVTDVVSGTVSAYQMDRSGRAHRLVGSSGSTVAAEMSTSETWGSAEIGAASAKSSFAGAVGVVARRISDVLLGVLSAATLKW